MIPRHAFHEPCAGADSRHGWMICHRVTGTLLHAMQSCQKPQMKPNDVGQYAPTPSLTDCNTAVTCVISCPCPPARPLQQLQRVSPPHRGPQKEGPLNMAIRICERQVESVCGCWLCRSCTDAVPYNQQGNCLVFSGWLITVPLFVH